MKHRVIVDQPVVAFIGACGLIRVGSRESLFSEELLNKDSQLPIPLSPPGPPPLQRLVSLGPVAVAT